MKEIIFFNREDCSTCTTRKNDFWPELKKDKLRSKAAWFEHIFKEHGFDACFVQEKDSSLPQILDETLKKAKKFG